MWIVGGIAVLAPLGGCHHSSTNDTPCTSFIGSESIATEMTIVARTVEGSAMAVVEGGPIPVLGAPQGGDVMFAGVRARNLNGCGVNVTAALRDEGTDRIIGLDGRPVNLTPGPDGWGMPSDPIGLSDWANIPVCPSAAATRSVVGSAYLLQFTLTDQGGRTAQASLHVIPFCGDPQTAGYCTTLCAPQI
jgi:hypothetical protein